MDSPDRVFYEARVYSLLDFTSWKEKKELELSPKFQRRAVWPPKAQSYLIDTIIRRLPMPHIYVRERLDTNPIRNVREVVDGQQRLRAILSFIDDEFTVQRVHNQEFEGKRFSELDSAVQKRILQYPVTVSILHNASDSDIIEVFSRLNANSLPLNAQEKLNARFFGAFKQSVYKIGGRYVEFWRRNRILTETRIARMGEAELTGELVVYLLSGITDKKRQLEQFYAQYDEEFPESHHVELLFDETISTTYEALPSGLAESRFRSRPLFYSLFGVVSEFCREQAEVDRGKFIKALRLAVQTIEDWMTINDEMGSEDTWTVSNEAFSWTKAAGRATDNAQERKTRELILLNQVRKHL